MNKKSILLGLTLALVGCLPMGTSLAADTPHFKSNKAAAEYFWNEVFNKHDTAVIDTMVGPKYKQHSPEFANGKQAFKDGVTGFLKAYPESSAIIVSSRTTRPVPPPNPSVADSTAIARLMRSSGNSSRRIASDSRTASSLSRVIAPGQRTPRPGPGKG